jgi:uncharacterized protein (TIGR02246 family)
MSAPADFPRAFATTYAVQDAQSLAGMFTEDGCLHGLTGHFAQGRHEILLGLRAEFAGLSQNAKLINGKTILRALGPGAAILHQRYVVMGLRDASGAELPRIAALLTCLLTAKGEGWQALTATFAVLEN